MPFCEVNKTRLYYERSGAGQPLVLVHGSWVDSRAWDAVRPVLADSFEVVVYDRRGHSRSARPPGRGSIHEDVDDLAGLIDLLELAPVQIAGVSWGGSICLRLAAARPELVRSIAIHEPPLFDLLDTWDWPELAEIRADLATVAGRLESGDHAGAARHYFDRVAATEGGWSGLDDHHRRLLLANAPMPLE